MYSFTQYISSYTFYVFLYLINLCASGHVGHRVVSRAVTRETRVVSPHLRARFVMAQKVLKRLEGRQNFFARYLLDEVVNLSQTRN